MYWGHVFIRLWYCIFSDFTCMYLIVLLVYCSVPLVYCSIL